MLLQVELYKLFSGYRANGYGYGLAAQYSRLLTSYICQAQGPHFFATQYDAEASMFVFVCWQLNK